MHLPFALLCPSGPVYHALSPHKEARMTEIAKIPDLPAAAQRALAEAQARREASAKLELPPELGGRNGPEPVRFGDWEKKGLAIDF
jgi:hypothetical protein